MRGTLLRLNDSHRNDIEDVGGGAAAREVVGGFGEALEQRADGFCAADAFGELVADIAGFQIGEHQHVGGAFDA